MAKTPTTTPEEPTPEAAPPIPEYDTLTPEQIEKWAASTSEGQRTLAILYESSHQNRAEVLEALDAASAGTAPAQ
jgi:hypothetical protein